MPTESLADRIARLGELLRSRAALKQEHWTGERIRRALSAGSIVRVSHGWYAEADRLRSLYAEDRHLLTVLTTLLPPEPRTPRDAGDLGRRREPARSADSHAIPPGLAVSLPDSPADLDGSPARLVPHAQTASPTDSPARTEAGRFAPHSLTPPGAQAARWLGRAAFSYHSAATLHGLPLYRCSPDRVHATIAPDDPRLSSTGTVLRHVERLPEEHVAEVHGIRVTSLARTAADLARVENPRTALAAADAALRRLILPGDAPPHGRAALAAPTPEQLAWLTAPLDTLRGARGIRAARRLLALADHRAESPLESESRRFLLMLGFAVALQVRVPGEFGADYWVDFEFEGLGILGEVDGRSKYVANLAAEAGKRTPGAMRDSAVADRADPGAVADEIARIHYAEKRRHDWITGTTGKRLIRWGASELASVERFAHHLRAFGVPIPNPRFR